MEVAWEPTEKAIGSVTPIFEVGLLSQFNFLVYSCQHASHFINYFKFMDHVDMVHLIFVVYEWGSMDLIYTFKKPKFPNWL